MTARSQSPPRVVFTLIVNVNALLFNCRVLEHILTSLLLEIQNLILFIIRLLFL